MIIINNINNINNIIMTMKMTEPSLETFIGNIKLDNPFFNASGCWCYDDKNLNDLDLSNCGAIVTKTMSFIPRCGNPEPRYYDNTYLSVNSMGLPNMGYEYYKSYKNKRYESLIKFNNNQNNKKPLFFSISTIDLRCTYDMIDDIVNNELNGLSGIEFNISCPNIVGKGQMGYDTNQLKSFLTDLNDKLIFEVSRNDLAIGLKMSPYFDKHQFNMVCDIIKEFPRIDFIRCINGIGNGLVIDFLNEKSVIKPNGGLGGLGGSIVKPIGLSNVLQFKNILGDKVDIIGCGGITTSIDAFEYILSGANCVSVGTQLIRSGPSIFTRLNKDLKSIMKSKKYLCLNEFKNKLKTK